MEPLKRKGEATDKKIVLVGKKMTKIERKWAKSLLKAILSLKGKKTLVLSTENDTSSITVSEDGKVGSSRWSEDIFLALVEKGVQTEGSLLIRSSNEKGGVLYGVILGRGGLRTLSVTQLGRLFFKTYGEEEVKNVTLGQLKVDLIS